ncbi:hypothetical protein FIBSPDRAFT_573127 [Athelia psychrophila]|uniref:Uncharacterized protein n=1 Tax=Athelia psychrophila TaxID=1759441 RepID=A0A166HP77_9AGAM|nr:hypothetical protein FIBSPDRAFT_573127 [Fibularhizoctonia sp. CBS 109695]
MLSRAAWVLRSAATLVARRSQGSRLTLKGDFILCCCLSGKTVVRWVTRSVAETMLLGKRRETETRGRKYAKTSREFNRKKSRVYKCGESSGTGSASRILGFILMRGRDISWGRDVSVLPRYKALKLKESLRRGVEVHGRMIACDRHVNLCRFSRCL